MAADFFRSLMQQRAVHSRSHLRQGSLIPAVAIAIVVTGGAMGLVLNRYFLAIANEQLQGAVDAAALAAAGELANDDLLRHHVNPSKRAESIRRYAIGVANENSIHGRASDINDSQFDARFGRSVVNGQTGRSKFVETDNRPTSVIITGNQNRQLGNPVELPMPFLTGQFAADVNCRAEASISNQISGLRPFDAVNIPAWPIAIPESAMNTRTKKVHNVHPVDLFSWNNTARRVDSTPDGIDEFVLTTGDNDQSAALCFAVPSGHCTDQKLLRQFQSGWSTDDLAPYNGALKFSRFPLSLKSKTTLSKSCIKSLQQQIGMTRIVFVYSPTPANSSRNRVLVTGCVAVRLMNLKQIDGQLACVFQPAILATRTAMLSPSLWEERHPSIYRIALTQ